MPPGLLESGKILYYMYRFPMSGFAGDKESLLCSAASKGKIGAIIYANSKVPEVLPKRGRLSVPILKNLFIFSFAISCDAPEGEEGPGACVCKPNYEGEFCEKCGPGYYGQPDNVTDYCKPCECNGNIEVTDPDACDGVTGICQKCLFDTAGDHCERCADWFFGDAVIAKNCRECDCDRQGTAECDHQTGQCKCLPGVTGVQCDMCEADHWGFDSDPPVRKKPFFFSFSPLY